MNKKDKYKIKSRIWITGTGGTFLAEGRVVLLQRIHELGSISKAASSMKMSYKKAWEQINAMNKEGREAVVKRVSGGKGGGGTIVTEYGIELIEKFETLNEHCHNFLNSEIDQMNF